MSPVRPVLPASSRGGGLGPEPRPSELAHPPWPLVAKAPAASGPGRAVWPRLGAVGEEAGWRHPAGPGQGSGCWGGWRGPTFNPAPHPEALRSSPAPTSPSPRPFPAFQPFCPDPSCLGASGQEAPRSASPLLGDRGGEPACLWALGRVADDLGTGVEPGWPGTSAVASLLLTPGHRLLALIPPQTRHTLGPRTRGPCHKAEEAAVSLREGCPIVPGGRFAVGCWEQSSGFKTELKLLLFLALTPQP